VDKQQRRGRYALVVKAESPSRMLIDDVIT
jgi:hypothetical protein